MDYVQAGVSGLLLGGIYALVAAGLALYFGSLRLINLAHGEMVMMGSYVGFALFSEYGLSPLWTVVLIVPVGFAVGYLSYVLLLQRARKQSEAALILLTFGMAVALSGLARWIWGPTPRTVNVISNSIPLMSLNVSSVRLLAFAIGILLTISLQWMLQHTSLGKTIRGTAQNYQLAQACGIDVEGVYAVTFGIGAALAVAGGVLIGMLFSVDPEVGSSWTFRAFAIVAAGGLGNIGASALVGLGLGLTEGVSNLVVGSRLTELIAFIILVAVLLWRPKGAWR